MVKLDISTRNFEADDKIRRYLEDKIGGLEKYLPRRVRSVARAQVLLEEDEGGRENNRFVCEVIMLLPGGKSVSREGTLNMYAAVDIVEAKLKAQILTYKEKHFAPRRSRLVLRWLRRTDESMSESSAVSSESGL